MDTLDAGLSHQSLDPADPDVDPLSECELGVDTARAVGAAGLGVDVGDHPGQGLVGRRARGGVHSSSSPVVVARRRDTEDPTEHG